MTTHTTPYPNVSVNTLFTILADSHRRYTLYHLDAMDGETIALSALLESLCERVTASPDRLETQLRHVHLPKLADHNLIDYDARSETIRYHDSDRVESTIAIARREEVDQ